MGKIANKLKHETFSFISLSMSLFLLFFNLFSEAIIPIQQKATGVVMPQAYGISYAFISFSAGLILLSILSLYIMLTSKKELEI